MSNVPLGVQHVDNFIDLGGEHWAERDDLVVLAHLR